MLPFVAIAVAIALLLLGGLVQRGYMTRVWRRASRLGRGRRYEQDQPYE